VGGDSEIRFGRGRLADRKLSAVNRKKRVGGRTKGTDGGLRRRKGKQGGGLSDLGTGRLTVNATASSVLRGFVLRGGNGAGEKRGEEGKMVKVV